MEENFKIQQNVSLAPFTTLKIGGSAKFFTEVTNTAQLCQVLKYVQKCDLEFFILGGGSNILISDEGFSGLVIALKNNFFEFENGRVRAQSGAALSDLVQKAAELGLSGLEWAVGIPGTIGGAIRGNAGAYGSEIKDSLESVEAIDLEVFFENEKNTILKSQECHFGYRNSIFKKNHNLIICEATIKLTQGNCDEIQTRMKSYLNKRKRNQPLKYPSAGSFFKNPIVKNKHLIHMFESDSDSLVRGETLPAGWLIAEAGLAGRKIGGAQIMPEHANFIINTGGATAQDVIILASLIKQKMRQKFSLKLEEEVEYVGF